MKRALSGAPPKAMESGGHNGSVYALDRPGMVQVAWLAGAGHTAWVNEWPPAVRIECEEIIGSLQPRCSVEIYVPNLDHMGRTIDAEGFADELRQEITKVTGGQTSYRTEGDFQPSGAVGLVESTVVLKTFLPTVVNDALRLWLVNLLVRFGITASQDVVQVEVASHGYWIHTGLLRGEGARPSSGSGRNPGPRRLRHACSTAS